MLRPLTQERKLQMASRIEVGTCDQGHPATFIVAVQKNGAGVIVAEACVSATCSVCGPIACR